MRYAIREANAAELEAAAKMRAQAWRESLADLVPSEVLDNADAWVPEVAAGWAANQLERGATYWVALDPDRHIVGVAHADAAFEPDAPALLELKTLYLLERAQGAGLAEAMVHRAIGDDLAAYLWVIEGNDRAIAFYQRMGFTLDGEVREIEPGWPGARQVRMVRPAAAEN